MPRRLTPKQKGFIKDLLDNPKMTAAQAVMRNYDVKDAKSASVIASNNLRKGQVASMLHEYLNDAEDAVVRTINDWKASDKPRKREISTQNAQYLIDRVLGKATVKIEQQTNVVRIAINLSGDGQDLPAADDQIIDVLPD